MASQRRSSRRRAYSISFFVIMLTLPSALLFARSAMEVGFCGPTNGMPTRLHFYLKRSVATYTGMCAQADDRRGPPAAFAEISAKVWDTLSAKFEAGTGSRELPSTLSGTEVPLQVIDGFLAPREAAELLRLIPETGPNGERSWTEMQRSPIRNSQGETVIQRVETAELPQRLPKVDVVRRRIADFFDIPRFNMEDIKIVRYSHSEALMEPHVDWEWDGPVRSLGQRVAAAMIYLSGVPEDGAGRTFFPALDINVRPVPGRAILWPTVDANGIPLVEVEHAERPLIGVPDPDGETNLEGLGKKRPPYVKTALLVYFRDRTIPKSARAPEEPTGNPTGNPIELDKRVKALDSALNPLLYASAACLVISFIFASLSSTKYQDSAAFGQYYDQAIREKGV
eukprot:TRINITY_DN6198_c1_g1_i1.p1 TRINITY_DN6198_c1_g1~~TRINITY_DN6198_c1_g1_i1.p1  ORF type:complete len:397 (+),score=37.71 TRINITY_DN6198_c1_g1_i1:47-1237(+)